MWYELLNNRTVKVVEEKNKSKTRPGSLPILICFVGIDSTELIGHLLGADLHWWSCTPQPNSSWFRVLKSPQLATRCAKERSPTTPRGLVFVSSPENKGWAPRGRWATHREQVWSQKSSAWTPGGDWSRARPTGVAFLQRLFCLWAPSASALPHPFYRYQPRGQLSSKESRKS